MKSLGGCVVAGVWMPPPPLLTPKKKTPYNPLTISVVTLLSLIDIFVCSYYLVLLASLISSVIVVINASMLFILFCSPRL